MNTTLKNVIGAAAVVVALLSGYSYYRYVSSYGESIQPSSFRSFSVSGEGKVVAVPDVAQFSFSVITQGGTDIAGLQKQNTGKTNGIIAFLKSKGIDDKDVKTTGYNLDPRYQYYSCRTQPVPVDSANAQSSPSPCPPPDIVGYTISQNVQVKIRDFGKIGDTLGGVVQKGANNVSQLSFTIDDPTKVQADARAQAIQKAREKANEVAQAAGFSIGRLLDIQEGSNYPYPMYNESYAAGLGGGGGAMKAVPAPVIAAGSQEVVIDVTLRYEIK